jgi:hypothetical protein
LAGGTGEKSESFGEDPYVIAAAMGVLTPITLAPTFNADGLRARADPRAASGLFRLPLDIA